MKSIRGGFVRFLALVFISSITLMGQEQNAPKKDLRIKIQKDTGDEVIRLDTIITGRDDMDVAKILEELGLENIDKNLRNVDIDVEFDSGIAGEEDEQIVRKKIFINGTDAKELEWVKGMCEGEKPFLGVMIDEDISGEKGGLVVKEIVPGSAAAEAGLQSGDRLLAIDGKKVNTVSDIKAILEEKKNNDLINISFLRDDKNLSAMATLTSKSRSDSMMDHFFAWSSPDLSRAGAADRGYLGVILGDSSEDKGAFVKEVNVGSAAAKAGILPGDFITSLNGTEIKNNDGLLETISVLKPGDEVQLNLLRNGESIQTKALLQPRQNEQDTGMTFPDLWPFAPDRRPMPGFYEFNEEKEFPSGRPGCCAGQRRDEKERACLGLRVKETNFPDDGILIDDIISGSPAAGSELRSGFRLLKADGEIMDTYEDLIRFLETKKAGDVVKIVYRNDHGNKKHTRIVLGTNDEKCCAKPHEGCDITSEKKGLRPVHKDKSYHKKTAVEEKRRIQTEVDDNGRETKVIIIQKQPHDETGSAEEIRMQILISEPDKKDLKKAGLQPPAGDALSLRELLFYPNPSKGRFKICMDSEQHGPAEICIFSLEGKKIYSSRIDDLYGYVEKEIAIDPEHLGECILQVRQGNQIAQRKIMIVP